MKAGEVPLIKVADRKWNDDNIAATVDLELTTEVSCSKQFSFNNTFHNCFIETV